MNKLSEHHTRIIELITQGVSYRNIAKELSITASAVYKYCKNNNITNNITQSQADRNINLYSVDDIIIDFCNGMTRKELAEKYNKSCRAIESHIRRRKVYKQDNNNCLNNRGWIEQQLNDGKTLTEIAESCGACYDAVIKALKRFGINGKDWQKTRARIKSNRPLDTDTVIKLYQDGWAASKIAKYFGFTSDEIIRKLLRKNNIRVRRDGESNIKHGDPQFLAELSHDYLYQQYVINGKSTVDIAQELKCNELLVQRRLRRFNIKARKAAEYQKYRKPSKLQLIISDYFDEHNINHESSYVLYTNYHNTPRAFEIDEYLPDHKILIEVQGDYWHGLHSKYWVYQHVRSKMWSDLIKYLCIKRDLPDHRIVYLTNHDILSNQWLNRIFPIVNKSKFDKTGYKIKEVKYNDIAQFIIDNHYLSSCTKGKYYALFKNGELLAACVVSSPSRNEIILSNGKKCKELSRLVALNLPQNGLSFFIARVLRLLKNTTDGIVSFADVSPVMKGQHSGAIYRACNFKYTGETRYNYRYISNNGEIIHKKTLYNRARRLNMPEKEYAKTFGFHKIPEWPKLKFEYCF